jgi:hemerythrin
MDIIKWQDIYEVRVEAIDEQHRKLVSLVNAMAEAMRAGKGKTVVGKVLKELVEYTAYHFETEEEFFREHEYPEYEAHRKIHQELTRRARELKRTFDLGKPLVTAQVMQFLSDWLNKHIIEEDRKFGRYIESKLSPAKTA